MYQRKVFNAEQIEIESVFDSYNKVLEYFDIHKEQCRVLTRRPNLVQLNLYQLSENYIC